MGKGFAPSHSSFPDETATRGSRVKAPPLGAGSTTERSLTMLNLINTVARRFAKDEDGAVTVDFVVLCGAVVGIGIAAATAISGQMETAAENLASEMSASSALDGKK